MSPFRPSFSPQPTVYSQPLDFVAPLFSCSYKSLFPQPLSLHIHTKPPGGDRDDPLPTSRPSCTRANSIASYHIHVRLRWGRHWRLHARPKHFHAIAHPFAQRRSAISSVLNRLRTLSIATGVVPLFTLSGFREGSTLRRSGLQMCSPGVRWSPPNLGTKP